MGPDKDAQAGRDEFEVAWYTKELGRPLQRKLLQRRLDEIGEGHSVSAPGGAHADDGDRDRHDNKPSGDDRAG